MNIIILKQFFLLLNSYLLFILAKKFISFLNKLKLIKFDNFTNFLHILTHNSYIFK